ELQQSRRARRVLRRVEDIGPDCALGESHQRARGLIYAARSDERRPPARRESEGKRIRNGSGKSMRRLMRQTTLLAALRLFSSKRTAKTHNPPRPPSGDPDLQGTCKARNPANWDIEHHAGSYRTPAGLGVVIDPAEGKIPYQPWALEKKKQNFASRATEDP